MDEGEWDTQQQQWQPQQQPQHQHQVPPWVSAPPPPVVQGNSGMNLGGSLDSVERDAQQLQPWVTVVRARGKHDMRPSRWGNRVQSSHSCQGNLCSLDREIPEGNICAMEQFKGEWERVQVTADSGAIDSVIPRSMARSVRVKETAASRQGLKYRAANGTAILNEGEKPIRGYSNEANLIDMTMQVAEVTKPLVSVRAMVKAGNKVVLDNGDSYILNKATGVKTRMEDRNGAFVFDIWVPKGSNSSEHQQGYKGNYWQALAEEDEDKEVGFVGLDDLM